MEPVSGILKSPSKPLKEPKSDVEAYKNRLAIMENLMQLSHQCLMAYKEFDDNAKRISLADVDHGISFLIAKNLAPKFNVPEQFLKRDANGKLMEIRGHYVCAENFVDWWVDQGPLPSQKGLEKILQYYSNRNRDLETFWKMTRDQKF